MQSPENKTAETEDEASYSREQKILDNMPLVWSMVSRFRYGNQDKEELFQIGMIGLMQAVDRFDSGYGVRFSTYAVPVILGEIRRFLRDDTPVKITRSIVENRKQIRQLLEENAEYTIEEIAKKTNLSTEDVILAMESEKPVESIYEPVYDSGEGEVLLIEQLKKQEKPVEEQVMEKELLQQAFTQLEETEKRLIALRFYENKTQTQVGELLKITQVQVSRMEKKILRKMRQKLE